MRRYPIRLFLLPPATMLLAGCALFGPDTYGLGERTVEVEVGADFVLEVPVDVAMGERWYVTRPEPDRAVVRKSSTREEIEGEDGDLVGGAKGTGLFTFEGVAPGTTKIRLIECPANACSSEDGAVAVPAPTGDPSYNQADEPTVHTFTVTVRQP